MRMEDLRAIFEVDGIIWHFDHRGRLDIENGRSVCDTIFAVLHFMQMKSQAKGIGGVLKVFALPWFTLEFEESEKWVQLVTVYLAIYNCDLSLCESD